MHLSVVSLLLGSCFNKSISAACSFSNLLSIDILHYLCFFWELKQRISYVSLCYESEVFLVMSLQTKNPAQLDLALSVLNPRIVVSLKKHVV